MIDTEQIIIGALIVAALLSNVVSLYLFALHLRAGRWPRIVDFAGVSICGYYGLGLLSEIGQSETTPGILPLFSRDSSDIIITLLLILVTPWVLRLGACLTAQRVVSPSLDERLRLPRKLRIPILAGVVSLSLLIALQALYTVLSAPAIWVLRTDVAASLGPLVIWFYIPAACLAFVLTTTEWTSRFGKAALLLMLLCAVLAAIPIGERTVALLPVLMICMFSRPLSLRRAMILPAMALIGAALLLPVFKWQFGNGDEQQSPVQLVLSTIHSDISRIGILGEAVTRADLTSGNILPYHFAGYVYSAAFFIPRELAPWKGGSSAQLFTAAVSGRKEEDTHWGYGTGLIEEVVMNAGILLSVPLILAYGLAMGLIDRLRSPAFVMPTRLAMLWIGGYHLPALLQLFGPMLFVSGSMLLLMKLGKCHMSVSNIAAQDNRLLSAALPVRGQGSDQC